MFHNDSITLFNAEHNPAKQIMKSSSVIASAESNALDQITECMRITNENIKISSALPGHEHKASAVENARKNIDSEILTRLKDSDRKITADLLLRLLNISIKKQQAGNCYEFSLFCQFLLAKNQISSEVFRIKGGNHVFIVVNRDQLIPANEFMNWNRDAIVVDSFFNRLYTACEIPTYLETCVYDEETNKISYLPFNPETQMLDNDVLSGLIEDWEETIRVAKNNCKI